MGAVTAIYTARYSKIDSGKMGRLMEWPEVISEGSTIEECREMLKDALKEMIAAYREQGESVPVEPGLLVPEV